MILKNLEKRIWDLEGFQIRFVDRKSGRDIRGDKENVGNYKYERQAKNSLTVKQFIKKRQRTNEGGRPKLSWVMAPRRMVLRPSVPSGTRMRIERGSWSNGWWK